ncbi:MAG: segregation/condensation protein A [archaeon]
MEKDSEQNKNLPESVNLKQEKVHDILFSREIGWQEIIYDLINTEQLDPWDIDINVLANKYLEKINQFEEENYFISSKVLLAAALLLRIKSEILLNKYIKSIDEILFGKRDREKQIIERIELDEEIPELIPKSPIPRFKKVSIRELVESLNKAIITENRRIRKEIIQSNTIRDASFSLPKKNSGIKDKIKEIYNLLYGHLNGEKTSIKFAEIIPENSEDKITYFITLLHLENQKKIWLHQDEHFGDIHIWMKNTYLKHNSPFEDLKVEEEKGD